MLLGALCVAPPLAHGFAHAEEQAVLTVRVDNVSPRGGNLRLALYDRARYDGDKDPVSDRVVAAKASGPNIVTFAPVPPGDYAVKMFQDENKNEQFDQTWVGLPKERYGFSNNAGPDWLHLGPARFDAAKITLKAGANTTEIKLH